MGLSYSANVGSSYVGYDSPNHHVDVLSLLEKKSQRCGSSERGTQDGGGGWIVVYLTVHWTQRKAACWKRLSRFFAHIRPTAFLLTSFHSVRATSTERMNSVAVTKGNGLFNTVATKAHSSIKRRGAGTQSAHQTKVSHIMKE